MLEVKDVDQLMDQTIPNSIRIDKEDIFQHNGKTFHGIDSESGVLQKMAELASKNRVFKSYQG